jgi:hypothetical protein
MAGLGGVVCDKNDLLAYQRGILFRGFL